MFTLPDDPYARLGVSKDAQVPEIRSAHRKLVLKCHPDKVSDPEQKAKSQEEFQKVQRAYEMLSDSKERQKYDDMVHANEMEKENARRRADQAASFSSRTPPRRDFPAEAHHYNVRMAEPRAERSASGYASSPKGTPVYSTRTPPRSYEENIYSSSSYDDREPRTSRKAGPSSYERDGLSSRRAEEDKRTRREADKAWDKQRERAEKDRRKAEEKERDRREKEKEKERRKKEEKSQQKDRKRDSDDKRSRHRSPAAPYREEPEPIIVDVTHKSEKSSKIKANTHVKVQAVPVPVREAIRQADPPEDRHRVKQNAHLEFAAHYLQTSRSKGVPGLARAKTYHPSTGYAPPVPTPPPAVNAMAPPPPPISDDDEPVKRSSARRSSHDAPRSKLSSSHRKEAPRAVPGLKKSSTMPTSRHSPPEVPESPPRIHRAQTDSYSRPAPGAHPALSRAQTWYATPAEEDYHDRSRSRHQPRYHSDEDYDEYSEDDRYPRRSTRHPSPEASKTKFRYTVEGSKAIPVRTRPESPSRRGYKAAYYGHEANTGRPVASYDSYEQQPAYFPKVKYAPKYDVDDVSYAPSEAGYRMAEPAQVYGY